jgi:aldose 1-epimerase
LTYHVDPIEGPSAAKQGGLTQGDNNKKNDIGRLKSENNNESEDQMKKLNRSVIIGACGLIVLSLAGCGRTEKPSVQKSPYGMTADGTAVDLYTLTNRNGVEAKITNYGGIVVSLKVPDRKGIMGDVVLGFDSLSSYTTNNPFFGCLVGRYGNRIAKGAFKLEGVKYTLVKNNGPNHLHGGLKGFDKVVWNAEPVPEPGIAALKLTYLSKDGEEGYPGNLDVTVVYTLTDSNALKIDYSAVTDRPTPCNLTNHSYFNLSAGAASDILGTELTIFADRMTPVDKTLIPTGEFRPVEGTAFDFREPVKIGARIDAAEEQMQFGGGYDHNFVLNGEAGSLRPAAVASDSASGRVMELFTTEPGVQFYTGNFLDGSAIGKNGAVYAKRSGFCLETQHFPDSPNHPEFPSTILNPGETYKTTTVYKFSVK